jgi:hypothetical protein
VRVGYIDLDGGEYVKALRHLAVVMTPQGVMPASTWLRAGGHLET